MVTGAPGTEVGRNSGGTAAGRAGIARTGAAAARDARCHPAPLSSGSGRGGLSVGTGPGPVGPAQGPAEHSLSRRSGSGGEAGRRYGGGYGVGGGGVGGGGVGARRPMALSHCQSATFTLQHSFIPALLCSKIYVMDL